MRAKLFLYYLMLPILGISQNTTGFKQYSNSFFSIEYPPNWSIVQDDTRVTQKATISLQIMQRALNNYDIRPNINIIINKNKELRSTSTVADTVIQQLKSVISSCVLNQKKNGVSLSGCKGTMTDISVSVNGSSMRVIQYIVKKPDNTLYNITCVIDAGKYDTQKPIIDKILSTLIIK